MLDRSIIVAALRSPSGAAAEVLRRVLQGGLNAATTTALIFEYEAVATRPEQLIVSGLSREEALVVLDALAARMTPVPINWSLRPASKDPGGDLVVEAAFNAVADLLVTWNLRDLEEPCRRLGIRVLPPHALLSELEQGERA